MLLSHFAANGKFFNISDISVLDYPKALNKSRIIKNKKL